MAIDAADTYGYIYDKGSSTRIGMVEKPYNIEWSRILNKYSTGRIDAHYSDCGKILKDIEPGRHEMVIYRGHDRVWEGPIVRVAEQGDSVSVHARDVLHYTYRTILRPGYSDVNNCRFIEDRAEMILQSQLIRHEANLPPNVPPINVVPYITKYSNQRTRECREILPYQKLLYEEVEDLSSETGLQFATVGRRILLWEKTDARLGITQTVTGKDFDKGVVITSYGMELATFAAATDGEGHYGWIGEKDPYYGLWEVLDTVRPEGDQVLEGPPDRDQLVEQARLRLAGRNPTPVRIRVPANSDLNPRTALTMEELVPGVRVPVRADFPSRSVVEELMFTKIEFKVGQNEEKIQVSLDRAPRVASTDNLDIGSDL